MCNCGCNSSSKGSKLPLIAGVVALLIIIAILISAICRAPKETEAKPAPAETPVMTHEEIGAKMIEQRVNDAEYMDGIKTAGSEMQRIHVESKDAAKRYAEWERGFLSTNDVARAVKEKLSTAKDEAEAKALSAEYEKLVLADAEGAKLKAELKKHEDMQTANQLYAQQYIGDKLRKQASERAKLEAAASKKWQEENPPKPQVIPAASTTNAPSVTVTNAPSVIVTNVPSVTADGQNAISIQE